MADTLGDLVVRIVGDNSQLDRSIDTSGQKLKKFGDDATRIGKSITVGITVPLTAAATAFIVLADKQIQAEAALTNAIRATGREAEISVDSLKQFTAGLQDVTTYGDEAQLSALALVQQLADLDEQGLKAVLPGILDFSTAMGVDLQTAASLVGKTLGSSTNALSRYGIEIDATASPTEKLAQLTAELEAKFGGAAETAAEAGLGPFRQLKNSAGDLAEQFGTLLLPAINKIVDIIGAAVDWMAGLDGATKQTILTIGGLVAAIGPLTLAIGGISKALAALALPPTGAIVLAIAAVVALATGFVQAANKSRQLAREILGQAAAIRTLTEEEQAHNDRQFWKDRIELAKQQLASSQQVLDSIRAERDALLALDLSNRRALDPQVTRLRQLNALWDEHSGYVDQASATIEDGGSRVSELDARIAALGGDIDENIDSLLAWQDALQKTADWVDTLKGTIIEAGWTIGQDFTQPIQVAVKVAYDLADDLVARMARANGDIKDDTEVTAEYMAGVWADYARKAQEQLITGFFWPMKQEYKDFFDWYKENYIDKIADSTQQMLSSIVGWLNTRFDAEIAGIEASTLAEEDKDALILELKRKQARRNKALGIFNATIDTAQAIIGFLKDPGGLVGVVLSILAGATGAAQIAAIAAQPLPAFAQGGIVTGPTPAMVGEGGQPEIIFPLDQLGDFLAARGDFNDTGIGGPTHVVVNLDGRPILDTVQAASRDGRILIDARAVVA